MTTASTQRSRLRATSATGSRAPSATSGCSATTWPPSSRTAISNVDRVRSDGFSNSIATWRPSSASAVGACAAERPVGLHLRGELEAALELGRLEIEDRQEVLARVRGEARRAWLHGSGPVLRVDPHVLGAQVARPDRGRRRAGAEIDADGDVVVLQIRRRPRAPPRRAAGRP